MILNKKIIQEEVEASLNLGKYTEGLGEVILLFADVSAHKRGLNYRYTEFEVNFIIKPRIVDMLLLRVFKYNKDFASAYTFFSLITSNAITECVKDIRRADKGESRNVYYIEDVKAEVLRVEVEDFEYVSGEVYLENSVIKLK